MENDLQWFKSASVRKMLKILSVDLMYRQFDIDKTFVQQELVTWSCRKQLRVSVFLRIWRGSPWCFRCGLSVLFNLVLMYTFHVYLQYVLSICIHIYGCLITDVKFLITDDRLVAQILFLFIVSIGAGKQYNKLEIIVCGYGLVLKIRL